MTVSHWSDLPLVLTARQAAAVLQVQPHTVAELLDRGNLRGVKIGKEWRVSRAELIRFVFGSVGAGAQKGADSWEERAPALVNKEGILVVQAEPLDDLAEFVSQERERRVLALLEQVSTSGSLG